MTTEAGPLYEFTFLVDSEHSTKLDGWLEDFVEHAARTEGIIDVRCFEFGNGEEGSSTRMCQLRCRDDQVADERLDEFSAVTEAAIAREFGSSVEVSGRVLREDDTEEFPPAETPNCLNCGASLRGQYCGLCGQRARNRLISLWQLVSEAFGDLLELDSRLWRTVIPLLARPGQLTRDYLEGRRARYMPPFRTYLVLSLTFFVVAFFDPRDDLGLLYEPEPESTPKEMAEDTAAAEQAAQEIIDGLADEGIVVGDMLPEEDLEEVADVAGSDGGLNIQVDEETGACNVDSGNLDELPEWFRKRFTAERLKQVCERVTADKGKTFLGLLLDNIPVALIVLLPLMALVLKVLYPLSRRYFVEHLLFFVHFHAFFFLILILEILFARIAPLLRVPQALSILAIVAASLYIPVYLYMAMRRVYGQGRILTFVKYVALLFCYSIGATLTMMGAILFALVAV